MQTNSEQKVTESNRVTLGNVVLAGIAVFQRVVP
jgi:hypothetical protein